MYDLAPERQTAVQFIWRYVGLWTLLWALGFIDELDYRTAICDVPRAVGTIRDLGPEGFIAGACVRPIGELLDAPTSSAAADPTKRSDNHLRQSKEGRVASFGNCLASR